MYITLTLFLDHWGYFTKLPEEKDYFVRFVLESEKVEENYAKGKVLVHYYSTDTDLIRIGNRICVLGQLKSLTESHNPGEFNYKKYLAYQKIFSVFNIEDSTGITKIGYKNPGIFILASEWLNKKLSTAIITTLPHTEASVLGSITIGQQSWLEPETKTIFRDAGVMHVLVVSGSNVGLIASIFFLIFRYIFYINRRISGLITIPIIILYALTTGGNPPVIRATIMAIVFILSFVFKREVSLYQSLLLSCFSMLIFSPQSLFNAGFQLSVVATLGIIVVSTNIMKIISTKSKILNFFINLLIISLAAQLAVLPLMAKYFHKISLVAILSNVVVIPLSGVILVTGLLLLCASFIGGQLLYCIGQLNYFLVFILIKTVNFFANIPYSTVVVSNPRLIFWLWYYLSFITIILALSSKKLRLIFLGIQILSSAFYFTQKIVDSNSKFMTLKFLAVSNGD